MATSAQPQTNGEVQREFASHINSDTDSEPEGRVKADENSDFKIVDKLDGVPAIHDSVTYAQYVKFSRVASCIPRVSRLTHTCVASSSTRTASLLASTRLELLSSIVRTLPCLSEMMSPQS